MEKAIRVLKARMKEYKQINSEQSMEYYHSCENGVQALEWIQQHNADYLREKVTPYDGDDFIDQLY